MKSKPISFLEIIQRERKPMPPPTRFIPDKRNKPPKHKKKELE
jgi:hypothetical protein